MSKVKVIPILPSSPLQKKKESFLWKIELFEISSNFLQIAVQIISFKEFQKEANGRIYEKGNHFRLFRAVHQSLVTWLFRYTHSKLDITHIYTKRSISLLRMKNITIDITQEKPSSLTFYTQLTFLLLVTMLVRFFSITWHQQWRILYSLVFYYINILTQPITLFFNVYKATFLNIFRHRIYLSVYSTLQHSF